MAYRKPKTPDQIKERAQETGLYIQVSRELKQRVNIKLATQNLFLKDLVAELLEKWVDKK